MSFLPQPRRARGKRSFSHLLATLVVLVVWASDLAGWLVVFDNATYDMVARLLQSCDQPAPATVLCYVDAATAASPTELDMLIEQIACGAPSGIAVTFKNSANRKPRLLRPESGPWVLRSVDQVETPLITTPPNPRSSPDASPACVALLPSSDGGVHRWHLGHVSRGGIDVPTLETYVANLSGRCSGSVPKRYRIRYRGSAGSLPFVTSEEISQGRVVPSFFKDAVVLLGVRYAGPYVGVHTPTTGNGFLMSPLEYHGHALNTLLTGRPIRDIPPLFQIALLAVVGGLLPLIYRKSRLKPGVWLLLGAGCVTLIGCAVILHFGAIWIRPASLLVLQWCSCFVIWETQVATLQHHTRSFCLDVIANQRRQAWPSQFVASAEPWANVEQLFRELLSPRRCVLLRRLERQTYVRETQMIGCDGADLLERRRDFRRDPYDRAYEEGRPILLDQARLFLKQVDDETQYMVPLKFRGHLLGFAVVAVSNEILARDPDYLPALQQVADRAAEMLQRHRELHEQHGNDSPNLQGASLDAWHDLITAAAGAARGVSGKVSRLEGVISSSPHASLVFDLYGNLLLSNRRMDQMLAEECISSASESPTSVMAKLLGESADDVRALLRKLAAGPTSHVRTVSMPQSGLPQLLHLTPVSAKSLAAVVDDVYPFDLIGIRLDLLAMVGAGTLDWLDQAFENESMDMAAGRTARYRAEATRSSPTMGPDAFPSEGTP